MLIGLESELKCSTIVGFLHCLLQFWLHLVKCAEKKLCFQYCSMKKISQIDLSMIRSNPLFHNDKINRRASAQLIRAVFDDLETKATILKKLKLIE